MTMNTTLLLGLLLPFVVGCSNTDHSIPNAWVENLPDGWKATVDNPVQAKFSNPLYSISYVNPNVELTVAQKSGGYAKKNPRLHLEVYAPFSALQQKEFERHREYMRDNPWVATARYQIFVKTFSYWLVTSGGEGSTDALEKHLVKVISSNEKLGI